MTAPIEEDDEVLVSAVSATPIVLLGHTLRNFLLRTIRADTAAPSINDHYVLGPQSSFRDGIEDETVTPSRIGHDLEAIAPRTMIEDSCDEPVSRQLTGKHAAEIAVWAPALKDRPSLDEDVSKTGLGLLECDPQALEPPYVVSHDHLPLQAQGHLSSEELSRNPPARRISKPRP
jgi:hypothetical protein